VLRYPRRPAFGPSRFDVAFAEFQTPPEVGLSGANAARAVFPPCVHRAHGPRRAICVTAYTGPVRVIRHGLSSARRSATRLTEPFHDLAGSSLHSTRQRSWDFSRPSQFSLSAGPRISAVHTHMPLSDSFAHKPADFYGLPVAHFSAPSRVIVKKRSTARTIRPASGSCCRGQAEPLLLPHWNGPPANPAMGFLRFSRACRMLFHSTRVSRTRHRVRGNAANRRSLAFRWLPSARGF